MSIEIIMHAAIKLKNSDHFLVGKTHADCFNQGRNMNVETSDRAKDQGFITSRGRYVERPEAALVAFKCGQTKNKLPLLCSEDLWRDEGLDYNYVTGYYNPTYTPPFGE